MSDSQNSVSPITHVAIKYQGVIYSLPKPNRHHQVLWMIVEKLHLDSIDTQESEQGFLDADGAFLRRKPAWLRVEQTGQLINNTRWPGGLYSENLW